MAVKFLYIDLFCGFGGTTTGIHEAEINGHKVAKVIACVNHDPKAIKSHWLNYPDVKHFEEDIRTLDLTNLVALLYHWKAIYPEAMVVLWASLECTNFSKAKGGQPRDADSRTLADHLERYIQALNPDYVQIENVVEFMSWGPLDENGKPLSRKNGSDWLRWRREISGFGYRDEWKEMNSADYGAYTSRNRLFGCFAKHGLPIIWPQPTHSKRESIGMFGSLHKWNPVKHVLDLSDEGESVFNRKKPLSDKTFKRIYAGLRKCNKRTFLASYYGNGDNVRSIDSPAPTIPTKDRCAVVTPVYFIDNPSHGGNATLIDEPCCVIVARQDKAPLRLIQALMAENSIVDIKMRMLRVNELLRIQGFPDSYKMVGNQSDHKKFIGNSVVPHVVKSWIEAMGKISVLNQERA